ncbi:MAG: LptF/LptG family permease [Gemmatimonadales bacterium]
MRLLRRHMLRSVATPFAFSLTACTGLMMINTLAKRFGDLVGKDLPTGVIVEVLVLSIPFIIALTLPMAVLVAVLYGFSTMGSDNEITAMRANGISVLQMLRPTMVAGVVVMALNFLFIDQVLPRSNARLKNLQTGIGVKKPAFQMREQAINNLPPYFIRAARVYPGSGRLQEVEIFDLSLVDGRRVIYADSGTMAFDANQTDLILTLFVGRVHEYKTLEPGKFQVTAFTTNTIRVKHVQNLFERDSTNFDRGDREMTTCEMMDQVAAFQRTGERARAVRTDYVRRDLRTMMRLYQSAAPVPVADTTAPKKHCGQWRVLERAIGKVLLPEVVEAQEPAPPPLPQPQRPPSQAPATPVFETPVISDTTPGLATTSDYPTTLTTLAEVTGAQQDERYGTSQAHRYSVEIHKKYTISVACFSFVLIGVALALRFPRGGMGLVIGGGLLIFAIFYISMVGGESLADRGLVSPPLAMWFPNILVLGAGLIGLFRVNREFGSTRGGDLSDLIDGLVRVFRRAPKEA